jgi:hypothetical protein
MKIIDIKDSPGYNATVKNGIDSVSTGKIVMGFAYWGEGGKIRITLQQTMAEMVFEGIKPTYPCCKIHGAINKVSKEGLWRCLACGEGAFEVKE